VLRVWVKKLVMDPPTIGGGVAVERNNKGEEEKRESPTARKSFGEERFAKKKRSLKSQEIYNLSNDSEKGRREHQE